MTVVAFVDDLMDRSRISAALPDALFARDPDAIAEPDVAVVLVDLSRYGNAAARIRRTFPDARLIAFGPHTDRDAHRAASEAGADVVVARSVFFRDPAGLAYTSGQG